MNYQYLIVLVIAIVSALIQAYGIYVSFCKKWWLGALALLFPQFAFIVGTAKLFKRDILA